MPKHRELKYEAETREFVLSGKVFSKYYTGPTREVVAVMSNATNLLRNLSLGFTPGYSAYPPFGDIFSDGADAARSLVVRGDAQALKPLNEYYAASLNLDAHAGTPEKIAMFIAFRRESGLLEFRSDPVEYVMTVKPSGHRAYIPSKGYLPTAWCLRGAVGHPLDAEDPVGFVRLDPPMTDETREEYLKNKLGKGKLGAGDEKQYHQFLVDDVLATVRMLSPATNPQKNLMLFAHIPEAFQAAAGVTLPSEMPLKEFMRKTKAIPPHHK